ncbi:MAG: hypothetical protein GY705_17105, partial [Bacteroidetes bacterium]|nr:hypothetical protein [Bacteroidota bacterium]
TEDDKDIAILIGSQSLPEQVKPAVLCSPNDVETPIEFLTVGYWKLGKRSGIPIGGKLLGSTWEAGGKPPLMLETTRDNQRGISGAPLYIPDIDRVVGIITSYATKEKRTAFAIPADVIKEVWPELEFQPPEPPPADYGTIIKQEGDNALMVGQQFGGEIKKVEVHEVKGNLTF